MYSIAIHGGAGNIQKQFMNVSLEKEYTASLKEVIQIGIALLEQNKKAIDVVEHIITMLEDNPLFNAGKGSVFSHDEKNEMDASVMDGYTGMAGAVAGVTNIKNPIKAARKVMDESEHVLLISSGAEKFAKSKGLEIVDSKYFFDQKRWQQFQKIKDSDKSQLDHSHSNVDLLENNKFGTVGAVVLDQSGHLAAGSSTGGVTNKKFGRVGDSPLIGAGIYANKKCAVSCTGHGEFFIRNVVAYDVAALIEYRNLSVSEATNMVIHEKLAHVKGLGGLIALDDQGNIAMPFNTPGMYRACYSKNMNTALIKMYQD